MKVKGERVENEGKISMMLFTPYVNRSKFIVLTTFQYYELMIFFFAD